MFRLHLVSDYKQAWKWSSMRLLGLSGIAELALKYFKDLPSEATQFIDPKVLSYVATGAFLLAFLGRITEMKKGSDVEPPKSS